MTRAERLAILGPESVEEIAGLVAAAPEPTPDQLALLRRIFTAARRQHDEAAAA